MASIERKSNLKFETLHWLCLPLKQCDNSLGMMVGTIWWVKAHAVIWLGHVKMKLSVKRTSAFFGVSLGLSSMYV